MDEFYAIPLDPQYNWTIRKLQDTDPASASDTFNPLFEQMIENIAAVKRQLDEMNGTVGSAGPQYQYLVVDGLPHEGARTTTIFEAYEDPVNVDRHLRLDLWLENESNSVGLYTSVFLHMAAGENFASISRYIRTDDADVVVDIYLDIDASARTMRIYVGDSRNYLHGDTIRLIIGYLPSEQNGGEMEVIPHVMTVYLDDTAEANGDGTAESPFNDLGAAIDTVVSRAEASPHEMEAKVLCLSSVHITDEVTLDAPVSIEPADGAQLESPAEWLNGKKALIVIEQGGHLKLKANFSGSAINGDIYDAGQLTLQ